ncbi:unnamed protein product [Caenorhabditis bovis]|uniref:BPTI/Kunitz inhibitor domain-containing protein n=1 Tax=Caenorhabditis bovis TaxID=2654633 RepID=A0A8S1EBD3_9PELO|nr:unnamed protein product [Caenorhabditis bovis]
MQSVNQVLIMMFMVVGFITGKSKFPDPPIFAAPVTYPSICYLPPDSALCDNSATSSEMELLTRFYFDVTTEDCYPFAVQKCGGNQNQFITRKQCLDFCKSSNS